MRRKRCRESRIGLGRSVACELLEVGAMILTRSESFLRERYSSVVKAQMRTYFAIRDIRELLKCLALRGVSDEEFLSQHQRTLLACRVQEYRFKEVAQVVQALGLFKQNGITGDLSSSANRSRLGNMLREYDRTGFVVAGVWIEFRVKGRDNTRRFVVVSKSVFARFLALLLVPCF
jgi:hypothetical protein